MPDSVIDAQHRAYWRANLKLVFVLLLLWATPSYLCGIVFVEQLNQFKLGGFPLGFWFAQQGSTISFVLIILAYAILMDRLDKKFGLDEASEKKTYSNTEASEI